MSSSFRVGCIPIMQPYRAGKYCKDPCKLNEIDKIRLDMFNVAIFLLFTALIATRQGHLDMAAIGSLVFCTGCGELLEGSSGDKKVVLTCAVCRTRNKGNAEARSRLIIAG